MKTVTNHSTWVQDFLQPRHPELVQPYLASVKICQNALDSGFLSDDSLSTLLLHVRNPHKALHESASLMLGQLADQFENARAAIRLLFEDKEVRVRITALIALSQHNVSPLHVELLQQALRDRSARVRSLAADRIFFFSLAELLPDLETAIREEKNLKVKRSLEWVRQHMAESLSS